MNTNELPGHPGIMPCADSSLCMEEVNLALLSCSLFCNREEIHLSKKAKKSTEKKAWDCLWDRYSAVYMGISKDREFVYSGVGEVCL